MKTLGTTLIATLVAGGVLAALPASAQYMMHPQLNTKRAALQQETAAAARLDYEIGEAYAYGKRLPPALPGRLDSLVERPAHYDWEY